MTDDADPPGGDVPAPDDPDPRVAVRPFGYVADRPVVRRIGDRDLFLGNRHAADPEACARSFAFVVSATRDPQPATTHHRPLDDGPGNDWPAFAAAVDAVRETMGREGPVLVHCRAGISRSSTLVATALAAEEGRAFREALGIVQNHRIHAVPNPALHELGVTYLAARG